MLVYKNAEYAANRLAGTIVRRIIGNQHIPIAIANIANSKVAYTTLADNIPDVCDLKELDLDPVPLGYINNQKIATYWARKPMRQDWRQGLRAANVVCLSHPHAEWGGNNLKQIAACIDGVYPTFKQCLGKVKRNPEAKGSIAFSRDFAIDGGGALMYKSIVVGGIDDNGEPDYLPSFEWASDAFIEAVN